MTVSSTPRRAGPYAVNGITTAFPFTFKVFEKTDVGVVLTLADGSYSFLTQDSDYTIVLNADQDNNPGGTVTYIGTGSTLAMLGTLVAEQDTDITNVGRFLPQVIENALDKQTILIQQLQEVSDRTLQAAPGTAVKLAFPAPSSGKFIRWRSDLTGLENADQSDNPGLQGLLNAFSGSSEIGHLDPGSNSIATNIREVARRQYSVLAPMNVFERNDFLSRAGLLDLTAAIQKAIDDASALGMDIHVPNGVAKIVPATSVLDESNAGGAFTVLAALIMRSGMKIYAEKGATFRIADGVSSNGTPRSMRMFFSNQFLSNIVLENLTLDMNGQNNPISPGRDSFVFNRWTQAHFCFSGTPGGVAAGANRVRISGCRFINGPGVSCIVMCQSNTPAVTLGKRWEIEDCDFEDNGLDTDDHSSVFGWAEDCNIHGNRFINSVPYNAATRVGGLVAYEIHGSNTKFHFNTIRNYAQGLWGGANTTSDSRNASIIGNSARVSYCFIDFYSANLSTGPSTVESKIQQVAIASNDIEITSDAVADTIKAFFKFGARQQPTLVNITGNVCRALDTTKDTVLALGIVSPEQLTMADQISIKGNTAAGVSAGLVWYFGGITGTALNVNAGSIAFEGNDLGVLIASPGGLWQSADIVLYGPNAGKVNALRVGGLQHPTRPIVTNGASSRARVFGKALIDVPVTWNGVSLGSGGLTTKKIGIDTDTGFANLMLRLTAGPDTTATGLIYPSFTGLVADASGTLSAGVYYPLPDPSGFGTRLPLVAGIDNTGPFINLAGQDQPLSNNYPQTFRPGISISVGGTFPCQYADV